MHVQKPSPKPVLAPQEQLAVALYLKTMNKAQAARDAGYASTAVFKKPLVQAAVSEQMQVRAERLRIGADWVLMELKRCYDTAVSLCDMRAAMRALDLIGKHTDIQAWTAPVEEADDTMIRDRLMRGRKRAKELLQEAPPVSFLGPPPAPVPNFMEPPPAPEPDPEFEPVDEPEPLSSRARELIDRLRGEDTN